MTTLPSRSLLLACALLLIRAPLAPAQVLKPLPQTGTELRVGYWHLQSFLDPTRERADVKRMAQTLHSMDCVALGEAWDDRALARLVNELTLLGGRWNKVKNHRGVGFTRAASERYGILYRSDKIEVQGRPRTIPKQWLKLANAPGRHFFEHRPFICSFAALDGRFDFTLMVVRITETQPIALHRARRPPAPGTFQDAELKALPALYQMVQDQTSNDQDVILMGNLQRNAGDPALLGFSRLHQIADASNPTRINSSATPIHLFFPKDHLREFTGKHGVIRFDDLFFGGNTQAAVQACSDHRPIWITLRVPERDDD